MTSPVMTNYFSPRMSPISPGFGLIMGLHRDPIAPTPPDLPRRKRRIFRPVRGNNSTGAYGKFNCTECRRVHLKCLYTSEHHPCEYCAKRNLKCEKTLTEKRKIRLRQQLQAQPDVAPSHRPPIESRLHESLDPNLDLSHPSSAYSVAAETDFGEVNLFSDVRLFSTEFGDSEFSRSDFIHLETDIGTTFEGLPVNLPYSSLTGYNVTPISNTDYSLLELHCLRRSVFTWSAQPFAVYGMVLKHLWEMYGFDLSHGGDTMRFAVMAFSVGVLSLRGHVLPTEFFEYITRCHRSLVRDMEKNDINETHLFAIYFLVGCCDIYHVVMGRPSGNYDLYRRKFCHTLEYLISRCTCEGQIYPLQHLWRYLLSHRRRFYSAWNFDVRDSEEQAHWMHSLDMRLSVHSLGSRTTTLPCYYPKVGEDNAFLHYYWDVVDIIQSLKASFKRGYSKQFNPSTYPETKSFSALTSSAFHRTEEFSRFQYLEQIYMGLKLTDSGTKASSGAADFFCTSYMHLSALLVFLRSVLQGYTSHYSQEDLDPVFTQVMGELEGYHILYLAPTLFCICVAFGSNSQAGLKAFSILASYRVKHFNCFNRQSSICSCQFVLAIIDYITSIWKPCFTKEDCIELLSANDWIWVVGVGCVNNSPLKPFLDNTLGCPKSWGISGSTQ